MRATAINYSLLDRYSAALSPVGRCLSRLRLCGKRLLWRWHVDGRHWVKRTFDMVVSVFVLLAFSPLFGVIALMVKLGDGGPLVVGQTRVGKFGREFKKYRFRKAGKWLRKCSLNELPQFYNVLKGDMSLVGPRPATPREVERYTLADRRRLAIAPGITGPWRLSGRRDISFPSEVNLDVQYIERQGFRNDVTILLKTVPAMWPGKGAS